MKVEAISFSQSDQAERFDITVLIGKTTYTFKANVKLVKLGEYEMQVINAEDKFWKMIYHNGNVGVNMSKLIRDIYNKVDVKLPLYLGEI